jgi:hypothetical protein
MKPTEKQIKAIDTIVSIVKSWKNTNDISSPTVGSDIHEFLFAGLEDVIYGDIEDFDAVLNELLWLIRRME